MGIWLVMRTADGGERPFPLEKARTVIGRDTRCDLRIAMPGVADRHCEILLNGQELKLQDLGSANGTLHNGVRIEQAVIDHRDTVTVGPVKFEVRREPGVATADTPLPEVKIEPMSGRATPPAGEASTLESSP